MPFVQDRLAHVASQQLSNLFSTEMTIGKLNLGLWNRLILEEVKMKDQQGGELAQIARISAKFDILPLFSGKVSIGSAQLFGFKLKVQKRNPDAASNFQFVIDALASKDTIQKENNIDLRINSLLIRRGEVSYDVLSEPFKEHFDTNHLLLGDIHANISLKALTTDTINVSIKRMGFNELRSGFQLDKLNFKAVGNQRQTLVNPFEIELPNTYVEMDSIILTYHLPEVKNFADDVHIDFNLSSDKVSLNDLSAFLPVLKSFTDPMTAHMDIHGTLNHLECSAINLNVADHFSFLASTEIENLTKPDSIYLNGDVSRLFIDSKGVSMLLMNTNAGSDADNGYVANMGAIDFSGDIDGFLSDFSARGLFKTDLGNARGRMAFRSGDDVSSLRYNASVELNDFKLGRLLGNKDVGKASMALEMDGKATGNGRPDLSFKGLVSSIEFRDYTYQNVNFNGAYRNGSFEGNIQMDDENMLLDVNGTFNIQQAMPSYDFEAVLQHVHPYDLHLVNDSTDASIGGVIRANFSGRSLDNMIGEISIDSLSLQKEGQDHFLERINISAVKTGNDSKRITLASSAASGQIEGRFSYSTLPASVMKILEKYIPSLITVKQVNKPSSNIFEFSFNITDTDMFAALTDIPIKLYSSSAFSGYFNENLQRIRVEGYFPRLRYDERFIESGTLLCDNSDDRLRVSVRFNNLNQSNSLSVAASAFVLNDSLQASINWGNNAEKTISGQVSALALFNKSIIDGKQSLRTTINVLPSEVVVSDTLWNILPSQIVFDQGKVNINDFLLSHEDRYLSANGVLSGQETDSVFLDLKGIELGYVFDVLNLGVNISGQATGPAVASQVFNEPKMNADLFIEDIAFNDGILGDAQAHLEWHQSVEGLNIDVHIADGDTASAHVQGYIYPIKPISALDLDIDAHHVNLKFLEHELSDLTTRLDGRADGKVRLFGKFKALTLDGSATVDASMRLDFLNVVYQIKDSVQIHPEGLRFVRNRIIDPEGHVGTVNGTVSYEHFKNINYNFLFDIRNMLLLNTQSVIDFPFYGTVYATGNVRLSGNPQSGMNVDVAVSTDRNSVFTYIKDYVSTATEDEFIKFEDKTPRRSIQDSIRLSEFDLAQIAQIQRQAESDLTDIRMNLVADISRNLNLRIVMDPFSGDYISCYGTGNLTADYFNKGDFKLFGIYNINQGVYKMSIQQLIHKDLNIIDGSSMTFDGDPLDGELDLQMSYQVNSASLNDLIPNASNYVDQTTIRVNCLLNMYGRLTSPSISMNLDLPLERDEVKALVQNYIATDEQMNTQILYLLTIGKFYTPDNVNGQNSNMMSSVVSSTLSGQLNNMLSNVINNNNWNFGTNFSTGENGWNDMEVEGILSGQLLNNRLLINGNFGYRENQMINTNFVGDFDAEWLVNRSGNIRLKAYNETNDRSYIRTNLTTQGIGIIFRKDFDNWYELFLRNKLKNKQ